MERREERPRGLVPPAPGATPRRALLRVPGSKSQALRLLVLAPFCREPFVIANLPEGEDVRAAAAAAVALGARLRREADAALSHGGGGPWAREIHAEESATLARLVTALAGLAGPPGERTVLARGTLLRRRSPPLFQALAAAGVRVAHARLEHGWPARVAPARDPAPAVTLAGAVSSQEASALLVALAVRPGGGALRVRGEVPSAPYLALTRRLLEDFGARVDDGLAVGPDGEPARVLRAVAPRRGLHAPRRGGAPAVEVETDASLAAVALCAGAIADLPARVPAFPAAPASVQGDARVLEHLAAFGARVERDPEGCLVVAAPAVRGARLDLSGEPDLAPPLAAVAAAVARARGERSRLAGLGTLTRKKSDRLAGIVEALGAAGVAAEARGDAIEVGPKAAADAPDDDAAPPDDVVVLDPREDHRMAFLGALLGLVRPGIRVASPGCVAKTWPLFWEEMERLGARVVGGG